MCIACVEPYVKDARLVVLSGSSATGMYTIFMAKARGRRGLTSRSGRKADFVTNTIGADEVVDYMVESIYTWAGEGVEAGYDCGLRGWYGLERPIAMRASMPQRRTTTPDIADLLLSASLCRAVLSYNTALGLVQVIHLNQALVRQHGCRNAVPERRIQRSIAGPLSVRVRGSIC